MQYLPHEFALRQTFLTHVRLRVQIESNSAVGMAKKFLHHFDIFFVLREQLNFPMLSVLAEHILTVNPFVLTGLRRTYTFVFLDEFQDTTDLQYQLTLTAFHGSDAVLTAVGDPKQTIMQWAGALARIFARFKSDFHSSVGRPSITALCRSWFESKLSSPLLSRTKSRPKLLQEILQTIQANAASFPSRIRALKRASWPHRLSPGSTRTACSPETSASSPEIDLPFTPVSFKTSFKISALRLALNPSFKIS